ncbi:hypothetical protein ACFQYP_21575 [Nonomuraea antimicrobica]
MTLDLDLALADRLLELARGRDAALHAVLVAAVGALLQRYAGAPRPAIRGPAIRRPAGRTSC